VKQLDGAKAEMMVAERGGCWAPQTADWTADLWAAHLVAQTVDPWVDRMVGWTAAQKAAPSVVK